MFSHHGFRGEAQLVVYNDLTTVLQIHVKGNIGANLGTDLSFGC